MSITRKQFLNDMIARASGSTDEAWLADALEIAGLAPWAAKAEPVIDATRLRYRVEVHEGRDRIEHGLFADFNAARSHAISCVDDALPHNTVHVYDGEKEMGHAYFRQDGESCWRDASPPPVAPITRERLAAELLCAWNGWPASLVSETEARIRSHGANLDSFESRCLTLAERAIQLLAAPGAASGSYGVALEDALRERDEARAEHQCLQKQVDELASFIVAEVPGEPSQNQGAIDTAIRIIRTIRTDRDRLVAELREAREERDRLRATNDAAYAVLCAPARVLGLPSVSELAGLMCDALGWSRDYNSALMTNHAVRLHAALSARRPASPVGLDEERLAEALIQADLLASHTSFAQSRKHAAKLISAYGATALPPIPEGDAGPKALRYVVFGDGYESWEDTTEEARQDYRAQWLAAVAILRPDAATGKGGGE